MNVILGLGVFLLATQGISGQFLPFSRRPGPGRFGGFRPGGGPPPGGPGPGGVLRFLPPPASICLRSCTAINLRCDVLSQSRMTQTCKACLDSHCPYDEEVPGFMQDQCPASKYLSCANMGSCPIYTTADQQFFSNCLKCRDGCLPKELKENIQKRMKQMKDGAQKGKSCRETCDKTHGCPRQPPRSCMECVKKQCGDGRAFECVHKAFGSGNCPTCKNLNTNVAPTSLEVVAKCRKCKDACGPDGDRRDVSGRGRDRGDGYRGDGSGRRGPPRDGERGSRSDLRIEMRPLEVIRHLSESVIECLSNGCSETCNMETRSEIHQHYGGNCMQCLNKLCPVTDSTTVFDLEDCRYRNSVSCGVASGCNPFPVALQAKRNSCMKCREYCLTENVKQELRLKMTAAAACRSNCIATSGCPKKIPGSCIECIQKECGESSSDKHNCRQNAISTGKCSMCASSDDLRRAPECMQCLRKCDPDDDRLFGSARGGRGQRPGGRQPGQGGQRIPRPGGFGSRRPGPGPDGKRPGTDVKRPGIRRLFGGDRDRPFLPLSSAQCLEVNCMKSDACDDENRTRDFRERLQPMCRLCRSSLCPMKPGTPMFDNNKCRLEAHKKCGAFFECKALDADTMAKRVKCNSCVDSCIPEVIKQQVRTKMMNAKMCRDKCTDTQCGDRKQCQACTDKICESSIYENCRTTAIESCLSCRRHSQTEKQCDTCMDGCMPAKPSTQGPPIPMPSSQGYSGVALGGDQVTSGMSCHKKCESYGCKPTKPGACQACIKSVCDDNVYATSCDELVRDNEICPSCNEEKSASGYDCKKCYDDCGAVDLSHGGSYS
uniref:uncharacterized protein LOC120330988 n=1 Tax=Styela clava TaxID=7725 RepID=UPI001939CF63|nr:uncharacterized protein LOC120330988 [Styela clava]XP_039253928.1 uncharacterized protein LOC120330988 [Styela clava]